MNYIQKLKAENAELSMRINYLINWLEENIEELDEKIEAKNLLGHATFTSSKVLVSKRDVFVAARNKIKS